jgi:hypothetical protein
MMQQRSSTTHISYSFALYNSRVALSLRIKLIKINEVKYKNSEHSSN